MLNGWGCPSPYPGELAYGIVARLLSRWNYLDHKGVLAKALGGRTNSIHPLTAPDLPNFAKTCLPNERDSTGAFLRSHTLLPYVLAFEQEALRSRIAVAMRNGEYAIADKAIFASRYEETFAPNLQLCPICFKEETQRTGEPYWHRVHQLPGVSRCPRHLCLLHSTTVEIDRDFSLKALTPRRANCDFDSSTAVKPWFSRRLERSLFHPTIRAAATGLTTSRAASSSYYRAQLCARGFEGRVQTLQRSRFEKMFADWMQSHSCNPSRLGRKNWWRPLITQMKGRGTTLQHLVLRAFISSITRSSPLRLTGVDLEQA